MSPSENESHPLQLSPEAPAPGKSKRLRLLPVEIVAHKRGTLNAPGAMVPPGTGKYGYETVMLENADSDIEPNGRWVYDGVDTAISSDNYDPTTKPAKGSALAGPDPIPSTPAAGPDGVLGTADDVPNPLAGSAGGKYVGFQTLGPWSFVAGQAPKGGSSFYGLGGLSTNYGSADRADKAHQMIGYAKGEETGKGCVFTATQIRGVGFAPQFKQAAEDSGVPALSPSTDAGAIKLFILDTGMGSVGLMHLNGSGALKNAFIGRKHRTNAPYHVSNYLAIKAEKPRP